MITGAGGEVGIPGRRSEEQLEARVQSPKFLEERRKATAGPSTPFSAENAVNYAQDDGAFWDTDLKIRTLEDIRYYACGRNTNDS
jgi:hypothetical protein